MKRSLCGSCVICASVVLVWWLAGCMAQPAGTPSTTIASAGANQNQVLRGRAIVVSQACGDCHGGGGNPASPVWLVGVTSPEQEFPIGPFMMRSRNIRPDTATGIGNYSDRQLFNALRYGLRPSATPDVEITSSLPGQGNHPAKPNYLAPGMPWAAWRHLPDDDLRAIVAYLKSLSPVVNKVADTPGPPDFWASESTPDKIGTHPAAPFPTANEVAGQGPQDRVQRGRFLVISKDCGGCHGGGSDPRAKGWVTGVMSPEQEFKIVPFKTYPRNLTPDNATGMGRFTERQIFNSLRYGLRPGETPDIEITSTTPGQGNHPANPKYLAPPMPWPTWRHTPDADLWAIAAYLKNGLRPVANKVADSGGPPDFWVSSYTPDKIGTYPAPPYPTAQEKSR